MRLLLVTYRVLQSYTLATQLFTFQAFCFLLNERSHDVQCTLWYLWVVLTAQDTEPLALRILHSITDTAIYLLTFLIGCRSYSQTHMLSVAIALRIPYFHFAEIKL